jgi:6-phosphogluconolactonase
MSDQIFLVGTGSKTIYACRLTANGQLQSVHENKSGKGPSWLVAHNDLLYAANEAENKIETFTIDDRIQGKLTSKNTISSKGKTPCSLAIDPTGQWLAVANYGADGSSNFVLLPINKSNFPEEKGAQVTSIDGHGPNSDRQDHSHCHQVQFYQGYLYVIDLGTDTINVYHYNQTTGEVRLNGDRIKTRPGAGPRHLLFHPDKPLAFVSNELDSTTNVYRIDAAIGKFEHQQTISTRRPEDEKNSTKENTPAELHFSPDQKYLLVSNRGDENLVIYNLNDSNDQILSVKNHLNIQGSGPRYFTFDPTGKFLLVANQNSNNLICFSYNQTQGTFQFLSQLANIESPQHILFIS